MMNKGRRNGLLWSIAIVLAAGPLLAAKPTTKPAPGRIRLTISRKTTHILGPVKKDGTVNYMAYLNAKHSKGVTKANNAAIPLIKIFGPDFLPPMERRKICEILKIEPPSKGGKYFITLDDYIEKTLSNEDATAWKKRDHLTKATTKAWKAKQHPVIAGWLKVNNGTMKATLVAMRRAGYYMPLVSGDPKDESMITLALPDVLSYRNMGNALVARAMLEFDSGDTRSAWADLMAARHLARRVGSGYSMTECFVAMAIEAKTCSGCRAMAGSGKLSGAQARAFFADMQRLGSLSDIVDVIDEGERFAKLDMVMMMARTASKKGLKGIVDPKGAVEGMTPRVRSLEWDEVLMKMNPWYDSFVAAARQKTFKARTTALAAHDRRGKEYEKPIERLHSLMEFLLMHYGDSAIQKGKEPMTLREVSQTIGDIMAAMFTPGISRAVVLRDRATAQGKLTEVAMALAAYKAEKKAYPDKLSQLAPGYLKKVPDDLFIDKPFGYKKTDKGYVLYSIGENMKYDGEKKEEDDDEEKDDIVVRVE